MLYPQRRLQFHIQIICAYPLYRQRQKCIIIAIKLFVLVKYDIAKGGVLP